MTMLDPLRPVTGEPLPAARARNTCRWLASLAAIAVCASPVRASEPPVEPVVSATAKSGERAVDRLHLDATSITGNRELPKVMSIVPWKAAEPPAGPDRPMGSLIEELLTPLDRDEFRREIAYHRDLTSRTAPVAPHVEVPGVSQP
ncbi:MAG TPA: hypothetical protein VD737_10695 [Steroidobacteraceae bacterium]|nr:hypothetical protein [Steroidobacteraceae bacterium]